MINRKSRWTTRCLVLGLAVSINNLWLHNSLAQTAVGSGSSSPKPLSSEAIPASSQAGKVFGRWQIACKANEPCRAAQSVITGGDTKVPVLVARLYQDPTPTLVLVTPLGSFLGPGMTLQVDKLKPSRLAFETCTEDGCILGVQISPRLQGALEKGKELSVTYFPTAQRPVTLKLSLDQFADAWKALK